MNRPENRSLLGVALAAVLTLVVLTVAPAVAQTSTAPVQPVSGRLLYVGGNPVAGAPVLVNENRGIASAIFGGVAAVFTLGLSCAEHVDPCRASGSAATQTGGDGRFGFSAAQVTSARKSSRGVIVVLGDGATTGSAAVRINPTVGGDVGDVSLWDPHPRIDGGLRVQWSAPAGANSQTELHGLVLRKGDRSGALAVLEAKGLHGDVTVDPRALEDASAQLWLNAGFSRPRANQNARVDWFAPPVDIKGAGVPLSRGKPCTIAPGTPTASPCRLTDGDLTTAAVNGPATVTIDLGAATAIGLVAARAGGDQASVSKDGVSFTPLDKRASSGSWPATLWDVSGSWRYIRVQTAQTQQQATPLSEVSVWSPGAAPVPTVGGTAAAAGPMTPSHHHRPNRLLLLIAVAALVAGGTIAYQWRRRPPS